MNIEILQKRLQSRQPFSLRLADGTVVPVPHPEFIWLMRDGKTAVVNLSGSDVKFIDIELVIALEQSTPSAHEA
jgi:hypothetical protein